MGCEQLVTKTEFNAFKAEMQRKLAAKLDKGEEVKIVEAGIGGGGGIQVITALIIAKAGEVVANKFGILDTKINLVDNKATEAATDAKSAKQALPELRSKIEERYKQARAEADASIAKTRQQIKQLDIPEKISQEAAARAAQINLLKQQQNAVNDYLAGKITKAEAEAILARRTASTVEIDLNNNVKPTVKATANVATRASQVANESKGLAQTAWDSAKGALNKIDKAIAPFAPLLSLLNVLGFLLQIAELFQVIKISYQLQSALNILIEQTDRLNAEFTKAQGDLLSRISVLQRENQVLKAQIAILGGQLQITNSIATTAQNTANIANKTAQKALNEANSIESALTSQLDRAKSQLAQLETALATLYAQSIAAINILTSQIEQLKKQLEAVSIAQTAGRIEIRGLIQTIEVRLENLMQQIKVADLIAAQLGQKANQAYNLASQAYNLADRAVSVAASGDGSGAAISSLQSQLNSLGSQVTAISSKPSIAPKDIFADRQFLQFFDGRLIEFATKDNIGNQVIDSLKQEVNNAKSTIKTLDGKIIEIKNNQITNQTIDAKVEQVVNSKVNELTPQLQSQLNSLGSQITTISSKPSIAPKDIFADKQFLQLLDGRLIEFATKDNIGNQVIDSLKQEINNAKSTIKTLDGKIIEVKNNQVTNQTIDAKVEQVVDSKVNELTPQLQSQIDVKIDAKIKQTVEPKLQDIAKMDDKQYQEITDRIKKQNDETAKILLLLTPLALIPSINSKTDKVLNQTKPDNLPTPKCLAPVYVPPVGAKVQANINLTNGLQATTIAQNQVINGNIDKVQGVVNTVSTKLGAQLKGGIGGRIIGMYDRLNGSKAMQYFSLILLVHNALMLSANIGNTIGYALDAIVSLTPFKSFKDENDNEIPFVKLFGNTIEGLFIKVFGKQTVKDFEKKYTASMRVYQASANMLNTVRSMMDSARDIAETTNVNVGEIGNALRRDGVVQNDAYSEMSTTSGTRARFISKLEKLNSGASSLSSVSSDLVDVKEDWEELQEQRKEYQKTVDEAKKVLKIEDEKIKRDTSRLPNISEKDEEEGKD
jgi:hypothetical protein